jgi:PhnB protein
MKEIDVYLNFDGNTLEAFEFYRSVFGGDFRSIQRFKDVPEMGRMSPEEGDLIMHISLPLTTGFHLMGSDVPKTMPKVVAGNNYHLNLMVDSEEEAKRLFEGLSKDAKVTLPLQKTFWGAFFGMCIDKYGINWMINYEENG